MHIKPPVLSIEILIFHPNKTDKEACLQFTKILNYGVFLVEARVKKFRLFLNQSNQVKK